MKDADHDIVLWLIRTGETSWDENDRLRGDEDLPMSDAGRAATSEAIARSVALPFPRPSHLHHADDEASVDTAKLARKLLGGRLVPQDDLADPVLGVLAGLSLDELRDRFERRARQWEEDPSELAPPEGEPFPDARDRIVACAQRILRRRPVSIGMVLHELGAGFLRTALAGDPAGNPRTSMSGRPRVEVWFLPADAASRLESRIREPETT